MVLRKEANRKGNPGKAGRGTEAALSYHVFSVEPDSPIGRGTSSMQSDVIIQQPKVTSHLPEYVESRISYLSAQLAERTNELERLREYTAQLEEGEKGLIQELTQQLSIKDNEISRIAALCAKKESENRKLSASFEENIKSQKEYAERIKSILVRKEGETAKLIEGLQRELGKKDAEVASLRRSLLEKKQGTDLSMPEENLPFVQAETLQRELKSRNREFKKLEKLFLDEQKLNTSVQNRLKHQIIEIIGHAEQLKSFVVEKEKIIQSLESTFEDRLAAKDAELSHIKSLLREPLAAKEQHELLAQKSKKAEYYLEHTKGLIEHLKKELKSKETEIISLREQLAKKADVDDLILQEKEFSLKSEPAEQLLKESEEKDREIKRLERLLLDEQKLGKSIQTRLKEQMAEMASQIEGLKSFIIEKEKLIQSLESAFEKKMAAKDEELRHFKGVIHAKPETMLHKELDGLRSELRIKEKTAKLMAEELAKLKEQSGMLRTRLEERQKIFFESEKAYEVLISELNEQHETRLKTLVHELSQKEASLKVAVEEEKVKTRQEMMLMKEKERQIEETLREFATTSRQLIKFGETAALSEPEAGAALADLKEKQKQIEEKEKQLGEERLQAKEQLEEERKQLEDELEKERKLAEEQLEQERKQLEERRKYAHNKEAELKKLLADTETKIFELKSKEAVLSKKEEAVERKEQLLLREQEAIGKELDVLTNAGIEINKSKQYLRQKLEQVGSFEQPVQQQPTMQTWQPKRLQQPLQPPVEIAEEQQPLPQLKQQPTQQAPSMQEMGFGAANVQEAQEEEGIDIPKFTGLIPETAVKKTPLEVVEEAKVKATKLPRTRVSNLSKKLTKAQQKSRQRIVTRKPQKPKQAVAVKAKKQKPLLQPRLPRIKQLQKLHRQLKKQETKQETEGGTEKLTTKPDQELFTELGGYSELEEIRSIVEIGLQHGDSIEQIRQSLTVSGYSKQNIEKALSGIKK